MKRDHLMKIAGAIWLLVGLYLLPLGLFFIKGALESEISLHANAQAALNQSADLPAASAFPLLHLLTAIFYSPTNAALFIVCLGLFLGRLKASRILQKNVYRTMQRLSSLPGPLAIKDLFTPAYLLLIAAMMGLGLLMKALSVPLDIRGLVDIAVGSALIHGALAYFFAKEPVKDSVKDSVKESVKDLSKGSSL